MSEAIRNARAGGVSWLLTIVTGAAAMAAMGGIVVSGNASATAANIVAHETALRLGVTMNLIATACYVAATLFVYELLAPVSRRISLLAAFFSLTGCAVGAIGSALDLALFVPIAQLQAIVLPALRLSAGVSTMAFLFFGLHCFLVGCLTLQSAFMPRIVGVLMVCAGLGWLTYSLTSLLSPALARAMTPAIMLPGMIGEFSLTVWLLVMGMKFKRAVLVPREG